MKLLSTGQVLVIAFKTFLKEPMWYLMSLVLPSVLTLAFVGLGYSLSNSLVGSLIAAPFVFVSSLMAAPFIMMLAFLFHYFITSAAMKIYLACGGKDSICYGISDDCELIEYEKNSEVVK
jgi:hypothetical protein